jgi:hypothetical protein
MNANRRPVGVMVLVAATAWLVGCPKKEEKVTPVVVTATATVAPVDTAPAELLPIEEDAGFDAGSTGDAGKKVGTGTSTNVARLRACCAQISAEARKMGLSPEAAALAGVAQVCNNMATQAGPNGTAPELGTLRNLLKGRTVPACQSF